MNKKLEFPIRAYDKSDNSRLIKVEARTAAQALQVVQSDPRAEGCVAFGLVGDDGNCHTWAYRSGSPHRRPGSHTALGAVLQEAGISATPRSVKAPPPVESATAAPSIISVNELFDVVMKRALPQMSPESFTVRDVTKYIPEPYRQQWLPHVWPAVMNKLRSEGVLMKKGHFLYARNPAYISKKLIEEPKPVAHVNGNGKVNGNGHDVAAAPVLAPAPAPVAAPTAPTLTADQKIDAVLTLIRRIATDDEEKKAKIRAIADRLVDAASFLDTIRSDLDAVMKDEQAVPVRMGELLTAARTASAQSLS